MSKIPLNHLLKIGADTLQTTAQTLSGAVNELKSALSGKQDSLTFDNDPTENSDNPVKSGGIFSALAAKAAAIHTHVMADITDMANGGINIKRNNTLVGSYTATQTTVTDVNIVTDTFHASAVVSNGGITFTGLNNVSPSYGYQVFFNITASTTYKNPYAVLNAISGEGTANMSMNFLTDAPNGTVGYIRLLV